jgi:hypothetical protein
VVRECTTYCLLHSQGGTGSGCTHNPLRSYLALASAASQSVLSTGDCSSAYLRYHQARPDRIISKFQVFVGSIDIDRLIAFLEALI